MKIINNSQNKFKKLIEKIRSKNLSLKFLFLDLGLLLIIVTMIFNISIAYSEGVNNLGRLKTEEEKLIKLQEENARLSEEEDYYKSIEFRKAYARDSLNLSREGETLYLIVRDQEEEVEEERDLLFNQSEASKSKLWKLLILGR